MSIENARAKIQQAQATLDEALAELEGPTPPQPPDDVIYVRKGDNLQQAVDGAPAGATIRVYPDTYPHLVLRPRVVRKGRRRGVDTRPITIQPDTDHLPPTGVRIDPSFAPALVKLSPHNSAALHVEQRAAGYTLVGVQLLQDTDRPDHAFTDVGTDSETNPENAPTDITFDRCLLLAAEHCGGKRGIALNCRRAFVLNSYFDNFWFEDDSQGVGGWNGPGSFVIENNYIAATGENILFGGGDSRGQLMQPMNLIVRRNTLTKKPEWQGRAGHTVKNGFELKNLINAIIVGNIIEYSWTSGQAGSLVLFTPRNQDGTAPYAGLANLLFEHNIVRYGAGAFQISGDDDNNPSARTTKVAIRHNLFYGIDTDTYPGSGRIFQILRGPLDVDISHNTVVASGSLSTFLQVGDGTMKADHLVMRDNVLPEGAYGIAGDGSAEIGTPSWDAHTVNSQFLNNLIARYANDRSIPYPATTTRSETGEAVVDPSTMKVIPKYAGLPTTDGKPIGCDVDAVLAATGATL